MFLSANLAEVNDDRHAPAWDGARNLADLGGLPFTAGGRTAHGRVFRSAATESMTDQGWADARAAGLATVVDLRNQRERGRGAAAGIAVVHAPTEDPDDAEFLSECGPWLDHPRSWAANLRLYPDKLARVFTAIAESGGPVLIHCAADAGEWTQAAEEPWTPGELDKALAERRAVLLEWVAETDVRRYLLAAGVSDEHLAALGSLLLATPA